jgi:hypothetical protein
MTSDLAIRAFQASQQASRIASFIAWALVGLPLVWGVWKTLENAAKILQ